MAEISSIEWTDATWNPITGCSVVSPGCTNCYAMRLAGTRLKDHPSRIDLTRDTKAGPVWNGEVRLNKEWLFQPLEWKRPRKIFVCAHGDLFAENVPDDWILDVVTIMAIAGHHTFQVLTKRAERMHDFFNRDDLLDEIYANWYSFSGGAREVYSWPLHNIWLGCSAEDQVRYDQRRRWLDRTPAAVKFWSIEPMLGPIEMGIKFVKPGWVIVGGESGPKARPMHPDWARSIRDQCADAGVPFFFKQWGEWCPATRDYGVHGSVMPDNGEKFTWIGWDGTTKNPSAHDLKAPVMAIGRMGKNAAGRILDGVTHDAMPAVGGA